jgi:hypothetical protein
VKWLPPARVLPNPLKQAPDLLLGQQRRFVYRSAGQST